MNDAVLALITLGYKQVEAHKAVKKVCHVGQGAPMPVPTTWCARALRILN